MAFRVEYRIVFYRKSLLSQPDGSGLNEVVDFEAQNFQFTTNVDVR
ncbi:MAG TPA: hypothetical protein PLU85_05275 [Bacteroidia bacterium]|nr:hypothetical protein [Bacteroidia bacterium]MBP7715336.1 hypothetical protein [Bacteroidia bacterium]HOZ81525.1 hypothetical protein [Bacteroidia bacterium]HOZ90138.1 hypothetical protein [Bacteroidia bacterium]HQW18194.1 hypothetical protein [Bacteroidia bacterium]